MREPQSRISHLQPPNVTFVQSRNNKNGLILIIDNGPQMTPEKWSVLRQGLHDFMSYIYLETLLG